tara:strand:+ start:4158 stop:4667 length:510 start_codon:yes stop_codon:yes gene_type:complete
MAALDLWLQRPPEEAHLFNPAFLGSLTFEFAKEFQKSKPAGVPLTLIPIALTVALHRQTRARLPHSTVSSLYEWMQDHEDTLIGFAERVSGLMPFVREALLFSLHHNALRFGEGHEVACGELKTHFSAPFRRDTTAEIKETIDRTKFMARWFAKSGSESSILACWGVRP